MKVIKLGGSVLKDEQLLSSICQEIAEIYSQDPELVLVHGGGPAINEELKRRRINWDFIEGLRVTSEEMVDVIEMVLTGSVNPKVVRALGALGLPAVGLSGTDGGLLKCMVKDARLGRVGEIVAVNSALLKLLPLPVVAPLGVGASGEAYNINADWAAASIAIAMDAQELIYVTDQDGIWDSQKKVLPSVDGQGLRDLIFLGAVKEGMLAKVNTILHALNGGISSVVVINGQKGLKNPGTRCVQSLSSAPSLVVPWTHQEVDQL